MLRIFDLLIAPLNKLLGSPGVLSLLKSTPLIIIPILAYLWGNRYLESRSKQEEQELLLNKIQLSIEANPQLTAPVSFYLLRASPSESYFNTYLDVIEHLKDSDSIYSSETIEESFNYVSQLQNFFDSETKYRLANNYFKSIQNMDSVLLGYLFIESDKYEEEIGQERIVELLVDEKFLTNEKRQELKGLLQLYLDSHKIKKSKKKKILPED